MPTVFFSYSHADEDLRDQLEKQLAMLKRQGVIETWHDRRIGAGQELGQVIDDHINTDDIILLLVSPDFIASDYCYDIEMRRAMERHDAGEALVIPVILRACDWHYAPFGKLLGTPRDGKPVTQWPDRDDAFLQVAKAVRDAAGRLSGTKALAAVEAFPSRTIITQGDVTSPRLGPRSSNLRLSKTFTQRDKDQFKTDTFEYIARYFENSLAELEARNPGYQGTFRRVDANRFFATIYKDGKDVARATVYLGGMLGGINYLQGETTSSNSSNESLSVDADDQMLFLTSMGMSSFGQEEKKKLTHEGAAELLWGSVIGPLQQRRNS
ncbi:toll/interleukin-1 receptor domain-containing protein [Xanthomonas campestris]|uniref:toll/interleukin-1 receptor domain-containing protein n=1 Tax=Xanthomonas campestris TaxID=339 RepID=UPI002359E2D7|nr:toll/interleukin-1 receptor domain-containing protein [Xanthomonas campestris]MDC8744677.1 TIR domain-containing protein [Xanthomonas campestris]MDM7688663.1 toll/interleukin-1 receptor domain-containing protein [Xanthomonas campestris pv. campestris]